MRTTHDINKLLTRGPYDINELLKSGYSWGPDEAKRDIETLIDTVKMLQKKEECHLSIINDMARAIVKLKGEVKNGQKRRHTSVGNTRKLAKRRKHKDL